MPLVSVILTSYNHADYLRESIESVLNQTFQDFELIIVDDCSTDNSWDIIQEYCDNKKIYAVRPEKNSRGFFCWEYMKSQNNGIYVAMHHSDDVWEPTKLEKQVAFLEAHSEYAACFTQVDFIDENSEYYDLPEGHFYKDVFGKENRSKEEWLNYFFYKGNCLCHPSLLIRKDVYKKYKLLDTLGLMQISDFLMWVRVCFHEEIYIYQEKLTKFRLRRKNQEQNTSSDKPENRIRSSIELYYVLQEYTNIKQKNELLKIFPNAKNFLIEGEINIKFALAKLALECSLQPYYLFAINILFMLINDEDYSKEIKRLYGYDYISFIKDTSKYDIFAVKRDLKFLYSNLYIDYGSGFNEKDKISKNIYLNSVNSFYVEYKLDNKKEIKKLRFDPTEDELIKISIKCIKIDDQKVVFYPGNRDTVQNEYDVFYSLDPQYNIEFSCPKYISRVEIYGKSEKSNNIVNLLFEERNKAIEEKNKILNSKLGHIFKYYSKIKCYFLKF